MVIKNTIPPKRPRADHMPIRKNIPPLRINHKTRSLTAHRQICIKRARLTEMDRHNTLHHGLNSRLPLGRIRLSCAQRNDGCDVLAIFNVVYGAVCGCLIAGGEDGGFGFEVFRRSVGCRDWAVFAFGASFAVHVGGGIGG